MATSLLALTDEARTLNYWQEFDVTFWQTLPFAVFWGQVIERQLSNFILPGSAPHWNAIALFAGVVSAGNALLHAGRLTQTPLKTGQEFGIKQKHD